MIKWFAYIVLILILAPALLSAKEKGHQYNLLYSPVLSVPALYNAAPDTSTSAAKKAKQQQELDDKKKIKEIGKAKRQPKPEKIVPANATPDTKAKPKRQRRPEGLERPPEIPRRNGGG